MRIEQVLFSPRFRVPRSEITSGTHYAPVQPCRGPPRSSALMFWLCIMACWLALVNMNATLRAASSHPCLEPKSGSGS
jgi:hypothetical protein